jgi:hypothetical protein
MVFPVKHPGGGALDELESVLAQLRAMNGIKEKSRGVFYRGSRAFLHFHEDPSGLFADVRLADDFERVRVETPYERAALLDRVRSTLQTMR